MFRIESKKDLRMASRAIREGWDVDKKAIAKALMEVIESRDPDLMLDAAKLLILADGIDVKREELQAKQDAKDAEHKLRLLELARSIPVDELTRIASENGIAGPSDARSEQ
jgi:hypothetical protein